MGQREVVVVSGVRTAVGSFGGSLKGIAPTDLGGMVLAEAIKRAGIDASEVEHCVMGNVTHSDRRDMYMSRVVGKKAGLPDSSQALTVNRLCGSGLQAIVSAAQLILLGDAEIAVAGGAESMSRVPYWLPSARFGARMGDGEMVDAMMGALTCPFEDTHMGITAENVAAQWDITREQQDELAVLSHNRAEAATKAGFFKEQILPVELKSRKGVVEFAEDEHVRNGATIEDMAKLRPVFKKDGTVTAGNASGLNDAAAGVVLMERAEAEKRGIKPLARLVGYTFAGVDPKVMGIGPVPAIEKLLANANLSVEDIDTWEVNEAFAAQALAVCKDLKLPMDKVNPNGSGISLGHPIGATGAIISIKAMYELERIDGRYAVVSMCIGGGQGIAALFERI